MTRPGSFLHPSCGFSLSIAEHILHITVYLSTFLQDTDYDILEAIKESKIVIMDSTQKFANTVLAFPRGDWLW
jgi:hypothetical protein